MQNEICEGVKLRARIKDNFEGEKISAHLLKREKNVGSNQLMQNIIGQNGCVLRTTDAVLNYAKDFYEELYSKLEGDSVSREIVELMLLSIK